MTRNASFVAFFAAAVLVLAGCSDDDGNGMPMDAGSDADVDAGNDDAGNGGDAGQTCEERVMEQQPDNDPACTTCLCDNCEMELEECNQTENCPELVACAATECPDDPTDTTCVLANCGDYIGAATEATAVGDCTEQHCSAECLGG